MDLELKREEEEEEVKVKVDQALPEILTTQSTNSPLPNVSDIFNGNDHFGSTLKSINFHPVIKGHGNILKGEVFHKWQCCSFAYLAWCTSVNRIIHDTLTRELVSQTMKSVLHRRTL